MRLILFDIDGTLVLTRGAGREATRLAMTEVFGTCGALAAHRFGGKTDFQTLMELLHEELGLSYDDIERTMPTYNVVMGRQLSSIIGQYAAEATPGALELVESLARRRDVGLGIVTGNVSNSAPVKLRAAGFDPAWFAVGAYGSEAYRRDNLPAMAMARAIEHYRQPITPDDVIVVGDTVEDISCARALGAPVVIVQTGYSDYDELAAAKPDYLLKDLTEFATVFA
jgi:phosphoglycolate phosphatase-like HAD superfamily hydrolase